MHISRIQSLLSNLGNIEATEGDAIGNKEDLFGPATFEKRAQSFVRFGRSGKFNKRKQLFVRFG